MSWSRKAAAVLLALVVFATAAPVFACYLPSTPARHACCRHMSMQCSRSMDTQASCCQSRPADPVSTPATSSTTGQFTLVAAPFAPHAALLPPASAMLRTSPAAEAPPPRLSSGASTSLRI